MNRVHFMSTNDNWSTPKDVYRTLDAEFGFDYDPCPLAEYPLFDGLSTEWGGGKLRESSILTDQGMVQKIIRGMAERKNRGHAHSFEDGYKLLARLHHEGKRDPLHSWAVEIWRGKARRTVPKCDCGVPISIIDEYTL